MNAIVPARHDGVEEAYRQLAPAINALGTGGDQPLRSTSLPPWRELERIGKGVKANLAKRTDAPGAASLTEILVGARVNAKIADPAKYLRAVRHLFTKSPPDVAAEAVYVLTTSNRFMPEIAEIEDALQSATLKRNQIVSACRAAYREQQRRFTERAEREQREAERERHKDDPCWQAWFQSVRENHATAKTFEEYRRESA